MEESPKHCKLLKISAYLHLKRFKAPRKVLIFAGAFFTDLTARRQMDAFGVGGVGGGKTEGNIQSASNHK